MDLLYSSKFDYGKARNWISLHETTALQLGFLYVLTIFSLKYYMKNRKEYSLKTPLILWNAFLAIFSTLGFVRMTPGFLNELIENGFIGTFTRIGPIYTNNVSGYWNFLWVLSKVPEFVDTIFIVLRKRPLIFMHWYHHALTCYFAFLTYSSGDAYMIWVVYLNYLIHSIMYSYFMLRSFQLRLSPQIAQIITGFQIVQFLITHYVMIYLVYLIFTTAHIYEYTLRGFAVGAFMEVTYLALWFQFYYKSYMLNGGKKYAEHSKNK